MSRNNKKTGSALAPIIIPSIIGAITTIVASYISYSAGINTIQIPIIATQTAEARQPTGTVVSSSTPLEKPIQTLTSTSLLENLLLQGDVHFVWQWAGENWYGRFALSELNSQRVISQADMGLIEKTLEDTILINGKVFKLAPGTLGTFLINDDGSITIDLAVEKKSRRTGIVGIETINGTLKQALCYVGSVSYSGYEGSYNGEMVLVNDNSFFGSQVDDWFSSNQDWFEQYIVDR